MLAVGDIGAVVVSHCLAPSSAFAPDWHHGERSPGSIQSSHNSPGQSSEGTSEIANLVQPNKFGSILEILQLNMV